MISTIVPRLIAFLLAGAALLPGAGSRFHPTQPGGDFCSAAYRSDPQPDSELKQGRTQTDAVLPVVIVEQCFAIAAEKLGIPA